jgi:hypothetical protein
LLLLLLLLHCLRRSSSQKLARDGEGQRAGAGQQLAPSLAARLVWCHGGAGR